MTMYPFNSSVNRNWDKRLKLHNTASGLLAEAEKMGKSLINIEDDDEWERRNDEIENNVMRQFWEIYQLEFALRYPESRNEWFKKLFHLFRLVEHKSVKSNIVFSKNIAKTMRNTLGKLAKCIVGLVINSSQSSGKTATGQ